jgi:hypothetical protein
MTRREKSPEPIRLPRAYRRTFQGLDQALEQNTGLSNSEKLEWLRRAMFTDVDELTRSGTLKLPP